MISFAWIFACLIADVLYENRLLDAKNYKESRLRLKIEMLCMCHAHLVTQSRKRKYLGHLARAKCFHSSVRLVIFLKRLLMLRNMI